MSIKANSKKNKDYTLPILFGVFAVLLIVMITALCIPKTPEFVPPAFEAAAVQGTPEVEGSMGYTELYKEGMAYRVSVCGVPTVERTGFDCLHLPTPRAMKNTSSCVCWIRTATFWAKRDY